MDWSHGLSDSVRRLGIRLGIMNVVSSKRRIPCRLNLQRSCLPRKPETPCKHRLVSLHNWSTYNHRSNDIIFQRFSPHVRSTSAFVRYFSAFVFGFIKQAHSLFCSRFCFLSDVFMEIDDILFLRSSVYPRFLTEWRNWIPLSEALGSCIFIFPAWTTSKKHEKFTMGARKHLLSPFSQPLSPSFYP
jgi:hypothetical protein